jgi:hypothetical protein
MAKIAIILFAGTETKADLGRAVNALEMTKEIQEAGGDVQLIFDGAGTAWVGKFSSPDSDYHELYQAAKDSITGACSYCANAFGTTDAVKDAGVPLLDEYEGHPSVQNLVSQDYQVITL